MPIITVDFPTEEEDERSRKFAVHKNYLASMALYLADTYGSDDEHRMQRLLAAQHDLLGYQRIQRRATPRPGDVKRFLTLSWASEVQLRLGDWSPDELVLPYSNAWAPVHAYYTVYAGVQAWLHAQGHPVSTDHTAVRKAMAGDVADRGLLPVPWSISCSGCPHIDETEFNGTGLDTRIADRIEVLQTPSLETFWPRFGTMLKTTRSRSLDYSYDKWRTNNNRSRLSKDDKRQIAGRVTPTTVFDFLWRLRVRSNYQDVEAFLMAPVGFTWHVEFYESLLTVTTSTALLLESLIARRIGLHLYQSAVADFLKRAPLDSHPAEFLAQRSSILLDRGIG